MTSRRGRRPLRQPSEHQSRWSLLSAHLVCHPFPAEFAGFLRIRRGPAG